MEQCLKKFFEDISWLQKCSQYSMLKSVLYYKLVYPLITHKIQNIIFKSITPKNEKTISTSYDGVGIPTCLQIFIAV